MVRRDMAITPEHVDYIAHLSRLSLGEDDKARFAAQLDCILEYVEKLNELSTDEVEPLVHMSERENVFREDVPSSSLPRKEALGNAPEQADGCFKVPSILE